MAAQVRAIIPQSPKILASRRVIRHNHASAAGPSDLGVSAARSGRTLLKALNYGEDANALEITSIRFLCVRLILLCG
jgi:hypothetical protein